LRNRSSLADCLRPRDACPSANGARVRLSGGKFSVTDPPFTESKEIVGGFALIEAKSKEEAIEHAKDFLKIAGEGGTEIRQIFQGPALGSQGYSPQTGERDHEALLEQWLAEPGKK
jgi:hypothetical protein